MAFAGAATGAPAQTEQSAATPLASMTGTKLQAQKLGRTGTMAAVAPKAVTKNPYQAVTQISQKQILLSTSVNRNVPKRPKPTALNAKVAPAGLNAQAVPMQNQPLANKHATVLTSTGINAFQQEQFGGYNLEPPDPTLCAGSGFVMQAVNNQIQISNGNLQKLTAPVPNEVFFGDFVNDIFDPLCSYNHSTGRWYYTLAVTDLFIGGSFSGVYIGVSITSDPRGPWNIYFLDLTTFGGLGGCAASSSGCLADQPNLGSDQYTIQISTNQFDLAGDGCVSGFCGATYILIDKVAMAMGNPFPNVVGFDISALPGISPDFDFGNCITDPLGPCWYSIQPADAANGRYDTRSGGVGWAMSSLDFFGISDSRIAVWRFSNTSTIGAFIPAIGGTVGILHVPAHHVYTSPGLARQPQNVTSPIQPNGNPLGDFLVLAGLCAPGTPPAGCSNPGPIASRDDRMRDTMLTTLANGSRIMWGGLSTGGSPQGVLYFGVNLGSSILSTTLARSWLIHNPAVDAHYPAVSIFDNGLALASYGISGPSVPPSGAYSVFSTTMAPSAIHVANHGRGVQDGFTQYTVFTGSYRPRWGDYSGAWTVNNHIFFTTEWIANPNCSLAQFVNDDTCGGTRTFFANWSTTLDRATLP
jgi:hypothetical protein